MDTAFASPERLPPEAWTRQMTQLADEPLVRVLLESVEGHLVVLNAQRQVVAANAEFLALCGRADLSATPGLRIGELLRCANSTRMEAGCGTSSQCASCGAVLAILEVLDTRQTSDHECHLCFETPAGRGTKEFRVKATPLTLADQFLVVVVFQDISAEKRRQVLEQVFFHDIKNLLAGLSGYSQLMSLQTGGRAAETIVRLSRILNSEVEAQALVARAEAGDLTARWETVDLESIVKDLAEIFREYPCAKGKGWQVFDGPPDLVTDRSVLLRILVNMVKNAYEASGPGDEVSLEISAAGERLRFAVRNPGVIARAVALRIFERSFSTKGEAGRGLGTYSMRLLAEGFLGGRVDFTSNPDQGTIFVLEVPRGPAAPH